MIRLDAAPVPAVLASGYVRQRRDELLAHLRRPPEERRQRRPPIDEELFYRSELREAVSIRSFSKCAFCERKDVEAHVDHYRPIQGARQWDGSHDPDHYAWLAYEWDNLVYLCAACSRAKEDSFPTDGERAPYLAALDEIRRLEAPDLIDPYHDMPERHFDFLLDGRCEPLTPRGRVTASLLELNRPDLVESRRQDGLALQDEFAQWEPGGVPGSLSAIFDLRRPFGGARLNILKRLLSRVAVGGVRIRGSWRQLPARLAAQLRAGPSHARLDLLKALDALREDDFARPTEGPQPPTAPRARYIHVPVVAERSRLIGRITVSDLKGVSRIEIHGPTGRRTRRGAACLMLLGENATGKSTLLQGIALALLGGPEARKLKLVPDDYLRSTSPDRWDQLTSETAKVDIEFLFGEGSAHFALDGTSGRILGHDRPASVVLGYGPRRYFDRRKAQRAAAPHARVRTLFDPLATVPYPGTWLNSLSDLEFDVVARALRPILALSDNDELVRDRDGRICVAVEDRPVPVDRLSEGYRSVFALATDIFREMLARFPNLEKAHGVVLIDEIETHLHPRWKMQVMRSLRRALPNVQFIATTHDPLCLRGMEDGEVVVLQRDAEGTIDVLKDLPSLKGMRAEQLLTSDYFGLSSTVDPETELGMARFAADVAERPDEQVTSDAVQRLTLGDSAGEQVVQAALQRFLEKREKPAGELRPDVRAETVEAIYQALAAPPRRPDTPREPEIA